MPQSPRTGDAPGSGTPGVSDPEFRGIFDIHLTVAADDIAPLAERVALPRDLMHEVLRDALGEREGGDFGPETIRSLEVDWDEFRAEYPLVTGTAADWLERLARAHGPAFSKK
ncbi:hypothetical protein ACFYOK_26790 [Microbispora bryophytorum]|uniref:hypothetical protein n=1 Tax=Microbispora bryophytorum TaxID=1460882 RepID=UPI0034040B33